jgi:D-glycero-alpha-D-manno-heptose-7-phosphate kinase
MIISRTPLRVSFFGGGTDFKDYYARDYGCVLSTAVNKYIYVMVNRRFDNKIQLNYRMTEIVDTVDQIFHPTIREALRFSKIEDSIELSNMSDVHAHGTGLGSSSSFLVGMLNAFYTYTGNSTEPERLAQDACKIEIDTLKEPIGKQDQYIAAYGGLSFIRFNKDDTVTVKRVTPPGDTLKRLESKLLFFYTGITRRSGQILKGQKQNIDKKAEVLDGMRTTAEKMCDKLSGGDIDDFGAALDESWEAKRSLAEGISNEAIDGYYYKAKEAGAEGGKILGAGGGGFLMFYCDAENQAAVRKALGSLREVKFKFAPGGSEITYNDEKEKTW